MKHNIKNKGMRLWLLGTGTPEPSLKRASSGYIVQIGESYIIFDHGFGAFHRLLQLGIPLSKVSHVFLSHYHFDHIGDFPRLVLTHWDQNVGKVPELKVYGPQSLQQVIDRSFGEDSVFGQDLRARTNAKSSLNVYASRGGEGIRTMPKPVVKELRKGDLVQENEWTVLVTEVSHQQPYLEPLAFRLEHKGQSFVYSGDTGPNVGIEEFASSCDVLVHMCHALSEEIKDNDEDITGHLELAELAKKANVKNLVLTHMSEKTFDQPGIRERVITEIEEIYKGNIFFGEDMMEIPFS